MTDRSARGLNSDAIDEAQRIFEEALAAYRSELSGPITLVSPGLVPEILQEALTRSGEELVRVVCGSWSEDHEPEIKDLLQQNTLSGNPDMLVLHCHAPVPNPAERHRVGSMRAEEFRVRFSCARLPSMIVVGSGLAVVRTSRHPGETRDLLIQHQDIVRLLSRIHGVWWERAADAEPSELDGIVLDTVQTQVLGHLCDGMKDETAARLMNISVRTYRRRVASLLKRMDTRSRFQAGLRAAQLGLTVRYDKAAARER